MRNTKDKTIYFWFLGCIGLIGVDQLVKFATVKWVAPVETIALVPDVFHLTYVENTGVAFGMMQGQFWLFTLIIIVATVGILGYFLTKTTAEQRLLRLSLMMILAGALGNYLDRITRGFVVDTFDFRLIGFWVFNMADTWVTLGCGALFVYVMFLADKPGKQMT